jgi:tRNA A37 threonylcarbamoyladenosine synthetase subunit TsaC/SUA5/YrdC
LIVASSRQPASALLEKGGFMIGPTPTLFGMAAAGTKRQHVAIGR